MNCSIPKVCCCSSGMILLLFQGMLKSVTDFASSVSRNMDRLSLDGSHIKRQEESRRHRPDGVGNGLKQGLTGFGLSLLGMQYTILCSITC